jgi:hypothetical protein
MVNTLNSEKSSVAAPAPASRNSSSSFAELRLQLLHENFYAFGLFLFTYNFIRNLNIIFFDLSAFLRVLKQPWPFSMKFLQVFNKW